MCTEQQMNALRAVKALYGPICDDTPRIGIDTVVAVAVGMLGGVTPSESVAREANCRHCQRALIYPRKFYCCRAHQEAYEKAQRKIDPPGYVRVSRIADDYGVERGTINYTCKMLGIRPVILSGHGGATFVTTDEEAEIRAYRQRNGLVGSDIAA